MTVSRVIALLGICLLYLGGCNLLNDYARNRTENVVIKRGITGLWYSKDELKTKDSFSINFGTEVRRFSEKQMKQGISCVTQTKSFIKNADSSFRLNLRLDKNHLLLTAVQYEGANPQPLYFLDEDNWTFLDSQRFKALSTGSYFELRDQQNGVALAVSLNGSKHISVKGSFLFRRATYFVSDSSITSILTVDPHYYLFFARYQSQIPSRWAEFN